MQCANCGAQLVAGAGVCAICGHRATPAEAHAARTPAGLPVGRYVPSTYGPPVRPDVVPHSSEMETEAPTRRVFGYRPVELPPPPPSRGSLARRLLRLCILVLVCGVIATAVAYARGAQPLHTLFDRALFHHATSHSVPAAGTLATPAPAAQLACPAVPLDVAAAHALTHVQLTTGLRDAGAHDYRPVNSVDTFRGDQTGYVTFQVATTQAGTVGVVFCTPAERIAGSISVLAGSSGRYGEFATRFAAADAGQGNVLLTWNGIAAAQLPFTVSR